MAKKVEPTRKERLLHILDAIDKILKFTDGMNIDVFTKDEVTQLAVIKLFEIMGESAYKIDKGFKLNNDHIEWHKIEGLRHILVHDYYRIQPNILWNTRNMYLPDLRDEISELIEKE